MKSLAAHLLTFFVCYVPFCSAFAEGPPPTAELVAIAPEVEKYQLVHALEIGANVDYSDLGVPYSADHRGEITSSFSRVAYYFELTSLAGQKQWIYASMDAFTSDINQVGVPVVSSGAFYVGPVQHLTVYSSETNLVSGKFMEGGSIEFASGDYNAANSHKVHGASEDVLDWGDACNRGTGHGCMQVHHYLARQTLFAFNGFGNNILPAVGIGNQTPVQTDWSLSNNLGHFTSKKLLVFVLPGPGMVEAVSDLEGSNVTVVFNQPLNEESIGVEDFRVSGGVTVTKAVLNRDTRRHVSLETSKLPAGSDLVVTVNDVVGHDGALVQPNSTLSFRTEDAPVAYLIPPGTVGTQSFNFVTGMDFDVHHPIAITHLGVFDNASAILPGLLTESETLPIVASVYDRNSQLSLLRLTFGPGTSGGDGALVGTTRFKALVEPLILEPGQYTLVSDYFGREMMGNSGGLTTAWTTNAFSGYLDFVGVSRFLDQAHDTFPTALDAGPANRYATATFRFRPLKILPPPPAPNLTITLEGENVVLSWPLSARNYILEEKFVLDEFSYWQMSFDQTLEGPDDIRCVIPVQPGSVRFFRLTR